MVVKKGNAWCVVHGSPKKAGSKTDKPKGTVIKCFSFSPGNKASETKARQKAQGLHYRITHPDAKFDKELEELLQNAGSCELVINERHTSKLADDEPPWEEAQKDLPLKANVWQAPGTDAEDPETWDYPHHFICNGEMLLHREGLTEAWRRATRESAPASVIRHLEKHGKTIGLNMKTNAEGLRHLMSNLIRQEELKGKDYLVCPTILICEGVHNNLFYPSDEIAMFPDSWNGRPVVVAPTGHPKENGKPVTASKPKYVEQIEVGRLFNCFYENSKLKGEVWIDVETCSELAPEILTMLEQNQNIEVSTGLFTQNDQKPGEWNGEKFLGTVYNYRPDHLALLPHDKGACSWEDGGGMPRVNKKEGGEEPEKEGSVVKNIRECFQALGKALGLQTNELSHDAIRSGLRDVVGTTLNLGTDEFLFVHDVFDKHFIYGVEGKEQAALFKQGYAVSANDEVELVGDRMEVKPKMEYVPVTNQDENTGGADDQGGTANEGGQKMTRTEKVNALIANSDWGEDDRELLEGMTDEQFARVEAAAEKPQVNEDEENKEGDEEKPAEGSEESAEGEGESKDEGEGEEKSEDEPEANQEKETVEDVIGNIKDPAVRETIERSVARDKAIKESMVKELSGNKSCPYSEDELKGKSIDELEKLLTLSGSAKKAVDFSVRAPAEVTENKAEDAVPAMPTLCPKKNEG